MTKLSVNINKIALIRNSRASGAPNVLEFARKIVSYGAQGITVHPRADQRHITNEDARQVARQIKSVETNFEGDPREDFLKLVLDERPTQCTLVPVSHGELTSHRGWDLSTFDFYLKGIIQRFKDEGIRVSLFMGTDETELKRAAKIGADRVEFYTAPYAESFWAGKPHDEVEKLKRAAALTRSLGMGVNAGHDLTLENLPLLMKSVPEIQEVSIGHYLVSHALDVGMEKAVKDYLAATHTLSSE